MKESEKSKDEGIKKETEKEEAGESDKERERDKQLR